jgi:uncharacterized membrane protein
MNLAAFAAARGASRGLLMGPLVGLLLLNRLAGMAIGGLAGAGFGPLSGSLTDYGISDDFIKSLGKTIPKTSSAYVRLVSAHRKFDTTDKVLPEIEPFKPRVLGRPCRDSRKMLSLSKVPLCDCAGRIGVASGRRIQTGLDETIRPDRVP